MDAADQVADENYKKFCHFMEEAFKMTEVAMKYFSEQMQQKTAELAEKVYNAHNPDEKLQDMMYEARLEANTKLVCLKEKGYLTHEEAQKVSNTIMDLTKYQNLEDGIGNLAGLKYLSEEMDAHMKGIVYKDTLMKEVDIMPQMTDALGDVTKINHLGKEHNFQADIECARLAVEFKNKVLTKDIHFHEKIAEKAQDIMERFR